MTKPQPDPFDAVLDAISEAPHVFVKAIATHLESLRTKTFLTPDAAWEAIGAALRTDAPELMKSYPTLVRVLSERVPGPEIKFEAPPILSGTHALGLIRMVRQH